MRTAPHERIVKSMRNHDTSHPGPRPDESGHHPPPDPERSTIDSSAPAAARQADVRGPRRGIGIAATAAAIAFSLGGIHVGHTAMADESTAADPSADASAAARRPAARDGLWAEVEAVGLREEALEETAVALGYSPRGAWISDDGIRWEHLDGRVVAVATAAPRDVDSGRR